MLGWINILRNKFEKKWQEMKKNIKIQSKKVDVFYGENQCFFDFSEFCDTRGR